MAVGVSLPVSIARTVGDQFVERVLNLWLPVPPAGEQARIARHIEEKTAGIALTVERNHMEIRLLREYRTRLIADVVTGKLDVREAAACLPEEPDDIELLDDSELVTRDEIQVDDLDAITEDAEA